jgi:hypothetical protein
MSSVIDGINDHPKPGDAAGWWSKLKPQDWGFPLEDEEQGYLDLFTSNAVPKEIWIGRGIATKDNLSPEMLEKAKKYFGEGPTATLLFANYENRRRILAHYVYSHPATIAYEIQLYRATRDSFPPAFIAERIFELFTGEEGLTGQDVSRLNAAVDLLIAIIIGRALKMSLPKAAVSRSAARALTDPLWDVPKEGGGMNINGRYYTEHALERMAPDTPEIRAMLRSRASARLTKLGLKEGTQAYDACLGRSLKKIDPRGIPPSVVEAEINQRGSTRVTVITARGGQVVITVIPR